MKALAGNAFVRSVGILTGGTVFAQGLMALSLPVLTRLYTPYDFSMLAVYTAVLGVSSAVSGLRLNIAIPIPQRDEDGINLLALALTSAGVIGILLALAVLTVPGAISSLLGQPGIEPYLWMIPVGVVLAAAYNALQYWASRTKSFGLITRTRMTRAVGGAGTQLGFGALNPTPLGLLLGYMVYSGLGVVSIAREIWRKHRTLLSSVSAANMRRNFITHRRFPLYSVPEAFLNVGGLQIPILVIAAVAAGPEAGFLMLAMQVMGLPMGLVGSSVAQVYLAEAPDKHREGSLGMFTRRAMWRLLKIGALPLVAAGIVAPFLFPIVFGAEWTRAGLIVAWMTPAFVLQFVSSPISMVLHVTGNHLTAMVLQGVGFVLRLGTVVGAALLIANWIVETFAVASAVFYGMYLITVNKVVATDT